jgi:glycosyltransferase involved in cell wall biosynthesis
MEHFLPVVGGAERSAVTLMEELEKRYGFGVDYLCSNNYSDDAVQKIRDFDVVITQLTWAEQAVQAARMMGKKSIVFVRSFENICNIYFKSEIISHCGQRCSACPQKKEIVNKPDIVISNSQYTKNFLEREHGIESTIVYPFIDLAKVKAPRKKRKFITMNQMAYHKGADIFLKIAERMPEYSFRIVGYQCWAPKGPIPKNVLLSGPLPATQFYSDTMLFVAPARWNETFGRTLIESQYNEIPVITSARGAAKEDGLVPAEQCIEDIENVDAWVEKIMLVLNDYAKYVDRTKDIDYDLFGLDATIGSFYEVLTQLAGDPTSLESSHPRREYDV